MSFESEKSFSDFTNFPRGIRRSGRFSVKESELLEEFGTAMMEIYKGEDLTASGGDEEGDGSYDSGDDSIE